MLISYWISDGCSSVLGAVAREIEAKGGRAMVHLADLSRPEAARGMVDAALETFGRVDTLVNSAAMRRDAPIGEITFESWTEVIGSILDATFLCSQACIPHLSVHGKGSIINIGGVAAPTRIGGRAHVVAAKAGVYGPTRGLSEDLGPQNTHATSTEK